MADESAQAAEVAEIEKQVAERRDDDYRDLDTDEAEA